MPAAKTLEEENIFFLKESKALRQDIRPLKILILNLMPDKITTETQLLRLIGNTLIQTEITLIHPKSHKSKNTKKEHLISFYKHFDDIKYMRYDGMIITGAPVEHFDFEEVDYWDELKKIMEWTKTNVSSTMYICWGAQAGLYYHYGIKKHAYKEKISGVFEHKRKPHSYKLLRGFDDLFYVPHSRYTGIKASEIKKINGLDIIAESKESGVYLIKNKKGKMLFVTGHPEYDLFTLKKEYLRDKKKGINPKIPKNYFPNNDPRKRPVCAWRSHAHLLFNNWINYYVYQESPFDWTEIVKDKYSKIRSNSKNKIKSYKKKYKKEYEKIKKEYVKKYKKRANINSK